MSSFASLTSVRSDPVCFEPSDIAFALAWEIYAPGLTGWSVLVDVDDDGSEMILVDPPLAYDNGFVVRREGNETVVSWSGGSRRVATTREAMLLICKLDPEALAAADALASAPALSLETP